MTLRDPQEKREVNYGMYANMILMSSSLNYNSLEFSFSENMERVFQVFDCNLVSF